MDKDGPALVGDPDLGFSGLSQFGPMLVHKTQLKLRRSANVSKFMVVDTPGMIDSPLVKDESGNSKQMLIDRGYDFEGVCKWYSERADVILLFFDPDKPGTTGETLSILTSSLVGMDHKLHIILNKADQFRKIHDFARAYGSLCWNLSKVIHRKDLPQIHTMCLPKSALKEPIDRSRNQASSIGDSSASQQLHDADLSILEASLRHPTRHQVPTESVGDGNALFTQGFFDLEASRYDLISFRSSGVD